MPTTQLRDVSIRATSTPGTSRRASGMLVAPDRAMSSFVTTKIAAGVFHTASGVFETEVISISPSCFKVRRLSAAVSGTGVCAEAFPAPIDSPLAQATAATRAQDDLENDSMDR